MARARADGKEGTRFRGAARRGAGRAAQRGAGRAARRGAGRVTAVEGGPASAVMADRRVAGHWLREWRLLAESAVVSRLGGGSQQGTVVLVSSLKL